MHCNLLSACVGLVAVDIRALLLQVGFIANLKSEKSHKVIKDVSGLAWALLESYTLLSCCNCVAQTALPACYCHLGVITVRKGH